MDKVLHEATQLLNDYNPKEALIKLSGFQNPSEQSFRLKEECKKLLRQQLLYLLKEADETNDYNEMEHLLEDYKRFLKKDEFYKSYYEKILQKRIEEERREKEEKEIEKNRNGLAIIPAIMLAILSLFPFIDPRSYLYDLVSYSTSLIFWVYLITASLSLTKIGGNTNKLYIAWAVIESFRSILSISTYGSEVCESLIISLMGLYFLRAIAYFLLMVFFRKKINETPIYKTPLIVGAVGAGITFINALLWILITYREGYLANPLILLFTYFVGTILMIATFLSIFLTSKKITQKKYETN